MKGMSLRKLTPVLVAGALGAALGLRLTQHNIGISLEPKMWLGLGLCGVLSAYRTVASKDRAPDQQPEGAWSALLHQVLVGASLALIVLPIPSLLAPMLPDWAIFVGAGFAVEALGVGLVIAARRQLGRNWSAGALCVYIGLAMISGTLHALIGLVLVCLAYARKIAQEERLLAQNFGTELEEYRRTSRAVF
jgi:protein-S-isoprenylcysteine O-methyltransferase Ste14